MWWIRWLFWTYSKSIIGSCSRPTVQNGGTAVLSETPEIYGAEHLLTKRAVTEEVGRN